MKKRKKQSTLIIEKKSKTDGKENSDEYIRRLAYSRVPMTQQEDETEAKMHFMDRDRENQWISEKERYYKEFPQFKSSNKINVNRIKRINDDGWGRNPVTKSYCYNDNNEPKKLTYQQCGIDYFTQYNKKTELNEIFIRSFGVTREGHSVCCIISGFNPYFFVHIPYWLTEKFYDKLKDILNDHLEIKKKKTRVVKLSTEFKLKNEGLQLVRTNTGELKPLESRFLKIELTDTNGIVTLRKLFEELNDFNNIVLSEDYILNREMNTYESNIPFELNFMIDKKMSDFYWITVDVEKNNYISTSEQISTAQLELCVEHKQLEIHEPEGEWSSIAPFRFLVFDIECISENKHFPTPETDKVCSIANRVFEHGCKIDGDGIDECIQRNVFHLKKSDPIDNVKLYEFQTEEELLVNWRDYVVNVDVDFIVGYNSTRFDIRYLLDRAEKLGIGDYFATLGRLKNKQSSLKKTIFSSSAYGTTVTYRTNIHGRYQLDVYEFIKRDMKLPSYTLNYLSRLILKDEKDDVHHSVMKDLFDGGPKSASVLYKYNDKDVVLTSQILNKQLIFMNAVGMCRITGVPFKYLIERGQGIKTYSKLLRNARIDGICIRTRTDKEKQASESYPGAKVFDPKSGFYIWPIVVLDFASLYPSVIIAYNLCWTTKVTMEQIKEMGLTEDDYIKAPSGAYFVKKHIREGLLPRLVRDLLDGRAIAKDEMKKYKGTDLELVYDAKQLALKITANSSYGYCGATTGNGYDRDIAWSVTSLAKQMIVKTQEKVEEKFTVSNSKFFEEKYGVKIKYDAFVIYGDTDSVMTCFGDITEDEAVKLGKIAEAEITEEFIKPNKLEYEKTYKRYLLVGKKRYAGLKKEYDPKKKALVYKIETKGLETVRRDNHLFTKETLQGGLDRIMFDGDKSAMLSFLKNKCKELLHGEVGIHKLILSQSLKRIEDYKSNPAHVELAKKMIKRDPATAPRSGDRIYYVMTKKSRKLKKSEIIENPNYVMEHHIPLDYNIYLDKMKKPVSNLFKYVLLRKDQIIDKTGMDKKERDKAQEEERKIAEKIIFTGPHMNIVKNDTTKRFRPYFYLPYHNLLPTTEQLNNLIIESKNTCYVQKIEITNSTDKKIVSDNKRFIKITFSSTKAMLTIKKAIRDGLIKEIEKDHKIIDSTSGLSSGIMNHFIRKETCINCKVTIQANGNIKIHQSLCDGCKPYKKVIMRRLQEKHDFCDNRIEEMKKRCKECQGNLPIKINCSNGDCDIFYERDERVQDLDCIKMDIEGLNNW